MVEYVDYRLAFILPQSRQLLGVPASGTIKLPSISIPTWKRPAEQITQLIEERWQIKTIVLDVLEDESVSAPCAVIEVRSPSWQFAREGLCPVDPDTIRTMSLGQDERYTLMSILAGEDTIGSPFSRIGWIEEVQQWISDAVCDRKITFREDIRQLNAGGRFALVRFGTEQGPAYWLKAVGHPNRHEFQIAKMLGERFPNYLPTIVAMRADWNAWVMEEAGQPLRDSVTLPSLEQAVVRLAELQKESIDQVDSLLGAGCRDRGIPVLEVHLREIREYLEDAMRRQTSTKVPRIEAYRLRELECTLRDACFKMQDLCIPNTLVHNDINLGNILCDGSRCVFSDWAEAYIGNPFLTFRHLCAGVCQEPNQAENWLPQMKSKYKGVWSGRLSESQIDQAFRLMPILAVASYLYGRGDWLNTSVSRDSASQGYRRSLARYMDRAAYAPELMEALCQ